MKAKYLEKKVRFADAAIISDHPSSPSNKLQSHSSASPFEPFTPRIRVLPLGPPRVSAKRNSSIPCAARTHPALQHAPTGPAIRYDLVNSPSGPALSLRSREVVRSLSRALDDPATDPPVHRMTIWCLHLPWTIQASPSSSSDFVSVSDVLVHIYKTLRKRITDSDYDLLEEERDREYAAEAYRYRYRQIRDRRESDDERIGGMRRVDFLMDMTQFGGLTQGINAYGEEGWVLSVMKR